MLKNYRSASRAHLGKKMCLEDYDVSQDLRQFKYLLSNRSTVYILRRALYQNCSVMFLPRGCHDKVYYQLLLYKYKIS